MTNINRSIRPLPLTESKPGPAAKTEPPAQSESLLEKTQRKAAELLDETYQKASDFLDQTPRKAGHLLDQAQSLLANEGAQQSFMASLDSDGDNQVSNLELRKQMDSNQDGYLDSSEIGRFALKAEANEIDKSTIQTLAQAANSANYIVLFESEAVESPVELAPVASEVANEEPGEVLGEVATEAAPQAPTGKQAEVAIKTALQASKQTEISPDNTPGAGPKVKPEAASAAQPAKNEAATAAPAPKAPAKAWSAGSKLTEQKEMDRTVIPVRRDILPSRDMEKLTAAKAGLFHIQDQVGNSCGTTSLSMIMKYYQGHSVENSVPTIDKYIRGQGTFVLAAPNGSVKSFDIDSYTAPRDIVNYANERGFRAGLQNNSSISKLTSFLDKGVPVTVLTDWNFEGSNGEFPTQAKPDGESLHYVNVIGYEYIKPVGSDKSKLHLVIANPHGKLQYVPEDEFNKVWSNVNLKVGNKMVDTGFNKMMIAMVPRDEAAEIVAPDGKVRKAGRILVPSGTDGVKGWMAQKGSEIVKATAEVQKNVSQRGEQLVVEAQKGYQENGVMGALSNLWSGDQKEIANLRQLAKTGSPTTRATIINQLLDKGINRSTEQTLIYDIMRESPRGKDLDTLIDHIDIRKIAGRMESDAQAGQIMTWLAKSEVDRTGKTGPKFEVFASHMAKQHRDGALNSFLENKDTKGQQLVKKAPATLVKNIINDLLAGVTDTGAEKAIYGLLKSTGPAQFDLVLSRLNLSVLASELEDTNQLGNLSAWVIGSATKTGHWEQVGAILTRLETAAEYTRADDVLGHALQHSDTKDKLASIPTHLRRRMIDLLDDRTRLRSDKAVTALSALKKL